MYALMRRPNRHTPRHPHQFAQVFRTRKMRFAAVLALNSIPRWWIFLLLMLIRIVDVLRTEI